MLTDGNWRDVNDNKIKWDVALCRRERLSIFRGEEGSAATASNSNDNQNIWDCGAAVAQGTHNPLVVGSNPSGPSFLMCKTRDFRN